MKATHTDIEPITGEDLAELKRAHRALEHPSLAARITSVLGIPVEQGLKLLPVAWQDRINAAAVLAVKRSLEASIRSLGDEPPAGAHDDLHKVLAWTSGAVGGFFGLPGLLVELPVTTTLLLRSIADIAHSHGEDLSSLDTRLACLEVFAVGGRSHEDDTAEIGYYGVRMALALHFSNISTDIAEHGVAQRTLPGSVKLVTAIAARFGVPVSEKAAAQMVPIVGAGAGALLNAIFMQHFQDVARGHFTVRRLERAYGANRVREAYNDLSKAEKRRSHRRRRLTHSLVGAGARR